MKITDASVHEAATSKPSSSVEIDHFDLVALNTSKEQTTEDEPMLDFQPNLPELNDLQLEVLISNCRQKIEKLMSSDAGSDLNLLLIDTEDAQTSPKEENNYASSPP